MGSSAVILSLLVKSLHVHSYVQEVLSFAFTIVVREAKIKFLEGRDGHPWVWVMGDHSKDKTIDQILTEEARVQARKQSEEEAILLR